jgi:hypothetical protein
MEGFAEHFHRAPQQLTQNHIREYQAHLFQSEANATAPLR